MKRDLAALAAGAAAVVIPSASHLTRRAKMPAWPPWGMPIAYDIVVLLFRASRLRAKGRAINRGLDEALNDLGGVITEDLRGKMEGMLHKRRSQAETVVDLRERLLDISRRQGGVVLVSTVVRILDEVLEDMLDDIETLELCVDPQTRDHLEREIRQIAASG